MKSDTRITDTTDERDVPTKRTQAFADFPEAQVGAAYSLAEVYSPQGQHLKGAHPEYTDELERAFGRGDGFFYGDRVIADDGNTFRWLGLWYVDRIVDGQVEMTLMSKLRCPMFDWCVGHDLLDLKDGVETVHHFGRDVFNFGRGPLSISAQPVVEPGDLEPRFQTYVDFDELAPAPTVLELVESLTEAATALTDFANRQIPGRADA
jgi:hypothetical protein